MSIVFTNHQEVILRTNADGGTAHQQRIASFAFEPFEPLGPTLPSPMQIRDA